MSVIRTDFEGDRGALFLLALKTGALTLLTAGIYRFWAKTRLRRWYWSAVRPGGAPMEYTGTPLEKLSGFLFAIIVLAILLAATNFSAIMTSVNLLDEMPAVFTTIVAIIPLLTAPFFFYARYRARRYILARTHWRGIRFGMEPGAIGYAIRACFLMALTVLTGGLLWPLMTFRLERFLTDRTWYGNARFTQHGGFARLYGPLLPFLVTFWGGIALIGYFLAQIVTMENGVPQLPEYVSSRTETWPLWTGILSILLSVLCAFYYKVAAIGILASGKTLGDGIEFDLYPRTRRILKIYFFGFHKTWIASGLVQSAVAGLIFGALWLGGGFSQEAIQAMILNPPVNVAIVSSVLTFLLLRLVFGVFWHTFITYPLIAHLAETAEIHNPELLNGIRQRDADRRMDAGGFAEALDTGAAF
ncbi:DUF898 family protein [Rhodobacterales bacterium HKCCE3408]|nr:DUF898 family protein [Rhodobacterales bacterium HKCCE3408]